MAFDAKRFVKTKFIPRTEDVSVPDMKDFFPDGEPAVWKVRGLTGQELGWAAEASERNKGIAAILSGLTSGSDKEIAQAVKELVGVGGNTPADIAKRIEHLRLGSVDPMCTQDLAVRLCEVYPVEFYQLTNAILRLTGQGQMPGKSMPSGEIMKSGPASPSAMPEGVSSTS
jgi:hypothetical protein